MMYGPKKCELHFTNDPKDYNLKWIYFPMFANVQNVIWSNFGVVYKERLKITSL